MPKPIPGQEKYRKYKTLDDIFLDARQTSDGCIEWQKSKDRHGYGYVRFQGRNRPAHRLVFELLNGKRESSIFVLHSCDNPPCINPEHLRWGTAKDNANDMSLRNRRNPLRGSEVKASILTEEDVLLIRFMYKNKIMTVRNMIRIFPVNSSNIYHIIARRIWKHI